ncbi:[FeFe] hydrogenase H-cluster maturation GTPase HydF [Shewanella sp. NIFS-20-20]|uniref:[FeFe] hydrogenase H-cluster maturation GTPase HydF n=1 Tax=Shewanella sp. NIFS-20-20 TaxID=2853806 RepID=UPI001C47D7BE|nr:[FeFe] hydrogenase H-cluster maturation GTPase HydF [Shewanella sp. NIFS-20-20]MBV7316915.1 [FeFe] hydrogenase H-cluster maturation GTPase HydF [Shewanella sp. NIFS-20-20]
MCNAIAEQTPRGLRYHIALAGRRNVGKSSLINLLTEQQVSIVSAIKGTTTDTVAKAYELLPLGPVSLVDTAGLDDEGELGLQRVKASYRAIYRADMLIYVVDEHGITELDKQQILDFHDKEIPLLLVFNKLDISEPSPQDTLWCQQLALPHLVMSATEPARRLQLCQVLYDLAPAEHKAEPCLAADLYQAGETIICVAPIDSAAPKGRLILPQVQLLREALDQHAMAFVCQPQQLAHTLQQLTSAPALVITDAQAIKQVADIVPESIALTTFSTLFSRAKGDLAPLVAGADALDNLRDGDKVLIAEACSHNVQADDIGRHKLPQLIRQYSGKQVEFIVVAGHDFPDDLQPYALVLHCGACMFTRAEMIRRIRECQRRGVAITNYGVAIAKLQGVMDRVVMPLRHLL